VNIDVIELKNTVDGVEKIYRPTVIWDDEDVVLFDTGLPGHLENIRAALQRLTGGRLNKIVITHEDFDHVGSLHEIVSGFGTKIEVYAHALTKPYIEGEKPLTKTKNLVPKVTVDHVVEDGQVLPFCGGISAVFTPGHMPDHTSFYHHATKTLITGDALTASDGQLQYPNPVFTLDKAGAIRSLSKFLDLDIETAICYHGGICRGNIRERIQELMAGEYA
jgi:glyoxylase-like metal-dependent hydrolase (beta-lactamase superfamily II)